MPVAPGVVGLAGLGWGNERKIADKVSRRRWLTEFLQSELLFLQSSRQSGLPLAD